MMVDYPHDSGRSQKRLLDYGCGSGILIILLRVMGYCYVRGIDVRDNETKKRRNNLYKKIFPRDGDVFTMYDGSQTPYESSQFDVIISQQVVEHVPNLKVYYDECYRLLSQEGRMLLDFPHLLMPYDSHARLWFVHWLPLLLKNYCYNILRKKEGGSDLYSKLLYLRSPYKHKNMLYERGFALNNVTIERLLRPVDYRHYEGNILLRKFVSLVLNISYFARAVKIFAIQTWIVEKVEKPA